MEENEKKPPRTEAEETEFINKIRTVMISRRHLLLGAAAAASAAAAGAALSACGGTAATATTAPPTAGAQPTQAPAGGATPAAGGATPAAQATSGKSTRTPAGKVTFLSAENYLGTWDPYNHTNLAHIIMEFNIMEPLIVQNAKGDLEPALAESWQRLDDTTVEFKLKQGVKFHDGQDFGAEDVKATLEYTSDPKQIQSFFWATPQKCEVVDQYTVRVQSTKPMAGMVTTMPETPIACKDDVNNPKNWEKKLNGTGAYQWVDYKGEDTGIELTAFMDYHKGPAGIKDLTYRYVGDANTRLAALQSGAVEIMDRPEPEQLDVIKANSGLAVGQVPAFEYKWLHFRDKKDPLGSNPKLRQAIAYAIDRESIVKNVLRDVAYETKSYLYRGQLYYSDTANFPTYDVEKAKSLLAEAGYPGGQGLRELEYITSVGFYAKTKEYGEVIVDNLKQIGINVKLNPMEVAAWNAILYDGTVGDMIDCGWFISAPEPDIHLRSLFYTEGRLNKYSNKDLDATLDAEGVLMDPNQRQAGLAKVSEMLSDQVPSFPILQTQLTTGYTKKLKNFERLGSSLFFLWGSTLEA